MLGLDTTKRNKKRNKNGKSEKRTQQLRKNKITPGENQQVQCSKP